MPQRDPAQPMTEPHHRRASDRVDADVLLAINDGDTETRHLLRGEMGEAFNRLEQALAMIRQDVQGGNLANISEFASLKATQKELVDDVAELRQLEPRVRALESGASTDHAVERALAEAKRAAEQNQQVAASAARESRRWSIGTIVSVVGMFGGYLAFFHG